MASSLRGFLEQLEASGDLIHFEQELSTEYEIAAAIKYASENLGKAIIFDKVKGYNTTVVGNIFGEERFVAKAFGAKQEDWETRYLVRADDRIKPKIVSEAPAQEVTEERVDIRQAIPVIIHHGKDAGAYMTSGITIAKDPETGARGMGLHRIQVKDQNTIGIFLATPPLSSFLAKAENFGKPLDIAIAIGVSPLIFCAAVFYAPEGIDKFEVAGGFAQEPVKLVKCRSVDVEAPADAEIILEGQILPHHREKEGPFGESTGYYFTFDSPIAKIGTITHRARPIYHALVPFTRENEVLIRIMVQAPLLKDIQREVPNVRVTGLSLFATGEICVVQIKKSTEEDALRVIDHLLLSPFSKVIVVVDEDVNIHKLPEVVWAVATRVLPDEHVIIKSGLPALGIDPSVRDMKIIPKTARRIGLASKMGIDATKPLKELKKFERIDIPLRARQKILRMMASERSSTKN